MCLLRSPARAAVGPGHAYEDRLVIPRADRSLRKALGELNAEEFYQGLMQCYQGMGLESSVVRTYERCAAALRDGLGALESVPGIEVGALPARM